MSDNLYIVEYLRACIHFLEVESGKSYLIESIERAISLVKEQPYVIRDVSFFGVNRRGAQKQKVASQYVSFALENVPRDFVFDKAVADIYGINAQTMVEAWKHGVRTVENFISRGVSQPEAEVYLRFYPELTSPIPRSEIEFLETQIKTGLSTDEFIFAGEYRRGLSNCDRICILVLENKAETLVQALHDKGYLFHGRLPWENDKYVDVVKIFSDKPAHRIEIYSVNSDTIVTSLLTRTGDNAFDLYLRKALDKRGFSLSKSSIISKKTGFVTRNTSEATVFEYAGIPYLPPERRNFVSTRAQFF